MSKKDEQIARMKGLMTYGVSNITKKTPVTESIEGADGKIYAIIREGSKFYIKSTQKGSELVTESFDYIGGFMNKKNNEFSSYNQASKHLELKLRSINEAYNVNKPVELLNPDKKENLVIEMTDAMKASIERYRQIMNNANCIMSESSVISASNTGNPEAPKTVSYSPKLGEPFTDTANAELDKDLKATANDPEKQGEPFGDNKKAEEYKDAQYVPDGSVANKKPTGGKVVRVNENDEYVETIEECDEWGSCGVPEVGSVGEVGDDSPFTEPVKETSLNEDAEDFVGFADENNEVSEGEDEIDLDDVDLDLDSDEMEETELDDIDTDENLDDDDVEDEIDSDDEYDLDIDNDSDSDEIESLKNEIEELRALVDELIEDKNGDSEDLNLDDTVEDDDEYDVENSDDFDVEDDDYIPDSDTEDLEEARKYVKNLIESEVKLPFEVKPAYAELKNTKKGYVYSLGMYLDKLMQTHNVTGKDSKIVNMVKGYLKDVLECDFELRGCIKNNHNDVEDWELIVSTMANASGNINSLLRKLSFYGEIKNDKNLQSLTNSISNKVDRYIEMLDKLQGVETTDYEEENDNLDNVEQNDKEYYNSEEGNDEDYEIDFDDINDMDEMFDSIKPRKINENGTKLNVFGKHPGYRKKVMSLPQTGSDKVGDSKDWNDDSVYSEEPFGSKIGKSDPFDEIINSTVQTVLESIKKKL